MKEINLKEFILYFLTSNKEINHLIVYSSQGTFQWYMELELTLKECIEN